jgi:cell division protein FtsI (penicillin-binding protein 3)
MSVGYEVRVSPLQILSVYNAVANGGVMMKPYLVESIHEYGQPVQEFKPVVLNERICSPQTLQSLQVLLKAVVDSGTAKNLRNPNYTVAGKTGTAQIADEKHGYGNRVYQSSFVGYFPAENPHYSCIVVVNAPSNGVYYGALVAAPVFREIADKIYATNLDLHPALTVQLTDSPSLPAVKSGYASDINLVLAQLGIPRAGTSATPWSSASITETAVTIQSKQVTERTGLVPDVKGMGLKDALYLLENSGLKVNVNGAGKVVAQSIDPNTAVRKGDEISIILKL